MDTEHLGKLNQHNQTDTTTTRATCSSSSLTIRHSSLQDSNNSMDNNETPPV